jgi:two-component system, LuxR family, response regulator FixJ
MNELIGGPSWCRNLTLASQMEKRGNVTMVQNLIPLSENYQYGKPVREIHVVDDDTDMRELLEAALTAQGFPVKTFEEGDTFLRATTSAVPICVFLDVVLPRRSGLEVLQDLRARRCWTPVFLMSAQFDVPTVVEAIKIGARDYIKKPFDPCELVPRVHNAVDLWLRRTELGETWDVRANESSEWFRLTPSEKEMLLLMRMMNA